MSRAVAKTWEAASASVSSSTRLSQNHTPGLQVAQCISLLYKSDVRLLILLVEQQIAEVLDLRQSLFQQESSCICLVRISTSHLMKTCMLSMYDTVSTACLYMR